MRKTALCVFPILFQIYSFGQIKATLPEIIPSSPEATAFMRAGLGKVNMSTGAINVSIPVYELSVNDYSLPVSLSYSSQGMKVDEVSSRVGVNWSLQVGGMISRTVRGKPDELAYERLRVPANFFADNAANYQYFELAANPLSGQDSQRDEYYFSFNGYSGKYVFNDSNRAVCLSNENLKIMASSFGMSETIITTPDGIKYYFGFNDAYEKTTNITTKNYNVYKDRIRTTLFLTKIELVNGESILFHYNPIDINTSTGISQTMTLQNNGNDQPCAACPVQPGSTTTQMNGVSYNSRYLSSITTSTGIFIGFNYEDRPDQTGDNRLKFIQIQGDGFYSLKYKFDYYDRYNGDMSGEMGRFFLTRLSRAERMSNELDSPDTGNWKHYRFRYHEMQSAAIPNTEMQDHFGFFNGITGLLPSLISNNQPDFSNRNPNPEYSMKGVLSEIVYPTGGVETFFYGPNKLSTTVKRNTIAKVTVSGAGTGTPGDWYSTTTLPQVETFTVKRNHSTVLHLQSLHNPDYSGDTIQPPANKAIVNVNLYQVRFLEDPVPPGGPGFKELSFLENPIFTASIYGDYRQEVYSVDLDSGYSYLLELTVRGGKNNAGWTMLEYDTASHDYFDLTEQIESGIRLERLRSMDSLSGIIHNKYYKYVALEDTTHSSGMGGGIPYYGLRNYQEIYCTPDHPEYSETKVCFVDKFLSNPVSSLFNFEGSHFYYTHILESDDPSFLNGGTEYTFYPPEDDKEIIQERGNYGIVSNDAFGNTHITLGGLLHKTRLFDKKMSVVQEKTDDFEIVEGEMEPAYSVYVNQEYEPIKPTLYSSSMNSFTAAVYVYRNQWRRKKSEINRIYDNGLLKSESKVVYKYGTADNIQPTQIITYNSKKDTLKRVLSYPNNYPSEPIFLAMTGNNMIASPVQELSYINALLLQQKKIHFRDWFGNGKVIRPDTIQLMEAPGSFLRPAIIYNSYDEKGNPLSFQKSGDILLSFQWGYNKQYPVTEIRNAAPNEFYHNSFEEGNEGTFDPTAKTGMYSHNGNYVVNFSLPTGTARTFIITYWAFTGTTWGMYTSTYFGNQMTLYGNKIDEIRIAPADALMTTYTYQPQLGITSITDINNRTVYYEYDSSARLSAVRDHNHNIIKSIEYNYAVKSGAMDCIDLSPRWVNTNVPLRCKKNSNQQNTGEQEQQQEDLNPCSGSFHQIRWLTVQTNLSVCPLPATCGTSNCNGVNKKCVGNACETGLKIYTDCYKEDNGKYWTYVYHYEWSDGSWSQSFLEEGNLLPMLI